MLCCLAVQLQDLGIGVTTNSPDELSIWWSDISSSDQYWYILIRSGDCLVYHNRQEREQWDVDRSAGNSVSCAVSEKGELHLYNNGEDVGVAWAGLPTDQPLWGFVLLRGDWIVRASCIIPKGEAVTCGEVVCGVSLNICTCYCHFLYFALHMAVV